MVTYVVVDVFGAIADPVRRDLLLAIGTGTARVVDLASGRPISRPAVSRHLRVLSDAGLVAADEMGRERHYRVVPQALGAVAAFLTVLAPADHVQSRPPITPAHLAALDLEVRRTGRDRRSARGPGTRAAPDPPKHRGDGMSTDEETA